jgi:hypothetical protein
MGSVQVTQQTEKTTLNRIKKLVLVMEACVFCVVATYSYMLFTWISGFKVLTTNTERNLLYSIVSKHPAAFI